MLELQINCPNNDKENVFTRSRTSFKKFAYNLIKCATSIQHTGKIFPLHASEYSSRVKYPVKLRTATINSARLT